MIKKFFLAVFLVLGYVAFTGTDVTDEYDALSSARDQVLDKGLDPLAKKALIQVSESQLDVLLEETLKKFGDSQ